MLTQEIGLGVVDSGRFDQIAFDDAMMRSKSAQKRKEHEAAVAWLLIAEAISYLPASPASAQ